VVKAAALAGSTAVGTDEEHIVNETLRGLQPRRLDLV
jgi:hypothetical protein